jgi:chromosome segregation ATPase
LNFVSNNCSFVQNNYERELSLHSTARTALRATREETESEIRLRKATEEQLENLKSQYSEQRSQWEEEKSSLESSLKQMEKGLADSRSQNSVLHSQLETLGDQIEKRMSEVTDGTDEEEVDGAFDNMRKTITELREVVKFLRSDKEMIQAQLDSAVRAAERERAAAAVVKRSLDAARAELKVLEDSSAATAQSSSTGGELAALKEKLATSEEKSRLLGESNTHLREEVDRLNTSVSGMKGELEVAKNSAQPHEKQKQALELEKAGLLSEKESLLREIDAWKGRVQSLVSKFNQVSVSNGRRCSMFCCQVYLLGLFILLLLGRSRGACDCLEESRILGKGDQFSTVQGDPSRRRAQANSAASVAGEQGAPAKQDSGRDSEEDNPKTQRREGITCQVIEGQSLIKRPRCTQGEDDQATGRESF